MRRFLFGIGLWVCAGCGVDVDGGNDFASGGSATNPSPNTSSATSEGSGGPSTDSAGGSSQATSSDSTTGDPTGASDPSDPSTSSDPSDPSTGSDPSDPSDPSSSSSSETTDATDPTADGTMLDPDLDVPDRGESCTTPGSLGQCPSGEVCRFHTAEESRCEGCEACGNLNAPCVDGTDCDILFVCFAGRCTNFCPLGTMSCGPPEACLDVGHSTQGVCDPFS